MYRTCSARVPLVYTYYVIVTCTRTRVSSSVYVLVPDDPIGVLLIPDVLMLFVLVPKKSATDLLSSEKSFKRVKKTHGQSLILVLSSLERHKQAVLCQNQIAVKIGAFFLINIWRHMNSRLAAVQVIIYLHIRNTFKLLA